MPSVAAVANQTRHCKTKAIMAHTLIHWRYHLNEWIVDYLQRKGIFSDAEILERERWSQKRRTKYANQVVDDMDEVAEINRLWRDFNTNLKAAREAKVRPGLFLFLFFYFLLALFIYPFSDPSPTFLLLFLTNGRPSL